MGAWVVVPGRLAIREARDTEIEFVTGGIGASYADLGAVLAGVRRVGRVGEVAHRGGDVYGAHVANELDAALGAPNGRLLLYHAHVGVGVRWLAGALQVRSAWGQVGTRSGLTGQPASRVVQGRR